MNTTSLFARWMVLSLFLAAGVSLAGPKGVAKSARSLATPESEETPKNVTASSFVQEMTGRSFRGTVQFTAFNRHESTKFPLTLKFLESAPDYLVDIVTKDKVTLPYLSTRDDSVAKGLDALLVRLDSKDDGSCNNGNPMARLIVFGPDQAEASNSADVQIHALVCKKGVIKTKKGKRVSNSLNAKLTLTVDAAGKHVLRIHAVPPLGEKSEKIVHFDYVFNEE